MPDVVCLGELLVDLCASETDRNLADAVTFVKAPGGAPANVAVGARRLGLSSGFVGAVGSDPFGSFLRGVLQDEGVDTTCLAQVSERTTLAFIAARADGSKDITFYRNPGADMSLCPDHVDAAYVGSAAALHFGSISRIDQGPRQATDLARNIAKQKGLFVSYDPNVRPGLWPDGTPDREVILDGFQGATVAKVSDEEWEAVTGTALFSAGAEKLLQLGAGLVVRSEGPSGLRYATASHSGHVPGFPVDCVETTGAGDATMACLIAELLPFHRQGLSAEDLRPAQIEMILRRSNAMGALACTGVGAIPSLPTADQLEAFLERQ